VRHIGTLMIVGALALAGCGGGGDSGGSADMTTSGDASSGSSGGSSSSSSSSGGQETYPSTAAIQSYMTQSYSGEQSTVGAAMTGCEDQYGENGGIIPCYVDAKEGAVQTFLSDVVGYASSLSQTEAINTAAVQGLFTNYQSQDIAWFNTTFADFTAEEITGFGSAYDSYVNSGYAAAMAQIGAL